MNRIGRHNVIPAFMQVVTRAPASAAVIPWYLAGGVSAANCIAAYQPKGAASLAASYVNLANPGTYDAAVGDAPSFDTSTGWTFNGTSDYLKSGVRLYQPYTILAGVSAAASPSSTDYLFGIVATSPSVLLCDVLLQAASTINFANGANRYTADVAVTGVLGFAGSKAYRDGTDLSLNLGGAWAYDPDPSGGCFIGSRNFGGSPNGYAAVTMYAFAIYNTTLSAAQVAAISTAMAAL